MYQFIITPQNLSERTKELSECLIRQKVNQNDAASYALSVKEIVSLLLMKSSDGKVLLKLRNIPGRVRIHLVSEGKEVSREALVSHFMEADVGDADYNAAVHRLMESVMDNTISVAYRRGHNVCNITLVRFRFGSLIRTMLGLFAGIIFGLVLKTFVPAVITSAISDNILESVSTMFLNAIKMVVGPLVFFSMAASISDFSNLHTLGRVAGKIVMGYLFTSLLAIGVGFGVYQLFPIGDPALKSAVTDAAASTIATGESVTISIKSTIVGIVPSSFVSPFVSNDMLQLIFMGAILGIAVGALSQTYPGAKTALNCAYGVFSKITAIIVGFMPVAVFCSMAKMVIGMDLSCLVKVAVWIPVLYFGCILMIIVYCILLLIFGRLNPLRFLKKYSPAMLAAYSLNSSSAAMPTSMRCCEDLGISKSIYSFSIPLGATINMDGSCIYLMVGTFFLAKIFGVPIHAGGMVTLIVVIMALSVGCPGVPGGTLVCLSMLLPQIGIPAEAISLIMGIHPLAGMGVTMVNVTGDAAISAIVAKSEKLLDLERNRQ